MPSCCPHIETSQLISETKTESSFRTAQFYIEGYTTPYRLESDINSGAA